MSNTRSTGRPPWLRRPSRKPTGRTLTIRKLIERAVAETGRAPSDADLASLLAIHPKAVRRHRDLLKM